MEEKFNDKCFGNLGIPSRVVLFLRVCSIRPFLFGPSYSGRESTEIFELQRETRGWTGFLNRKVLFSCQRSQTENAIRGLLLLKFYLVESKIKD